MLPHDEIKYRGDVFCILARTTKRVKGQRCEWLLFETASGGASGELVQPMAMGLYKAPCLIPNWGDVALANSKNGQNRLGKGDLIAAFDALTACAGDPVSFTNNSTALTGNIITYGWDFGDTSTTSDTSSVANPTYAYRTAGDYTVMFYISSDSGDRDTVYKTLSVYGKPNVGFDEVMNCFPQACQFTDTSSVPRPNDIESYTWSIDGDTYNTGSVVHNFDTTGSYDVKLVIVTTYGCNDSLTKTLFHGDTVRMSITPSSDFTICAGDTAQISASAGLDSYVWNTGATTQAIQASQAQTYVVTGYNGNNCFATDSVAMALAPSPTANAGADVSIKFGKTTVLQGSGGGDYLWSPATSLDDATSFPTQRHRRKKQQHMC